MLIYNLDECDVSSALLVFLLFYALEIKSTVFYIKMYVKVDHKIGCDQVSLSEYSAISAMEVLEVITLGWLGFLGASLSLHTPLGTLLSTYLSTR